jgi:beta-galactosidase
MVRTLAAIAIAVLFLASQPVSAEIYKGEASDRVVINLGETPWKLIKNDANGGQNVTYNDAAAPEVGIPHCFLDDSSFVNAGAGWGSTPGGPYWYRKRIKFSAADASKKIFIEFEGSHMGMQLYVNGNLVNGSSAVNPQATHVIGFMGVLLDITDRVTFDGSDNLIAVRVAMNGSFFTGPIFSSVYRFGQGTGGLFRPVYLYKVNKVHIPQNTYSGTKQWGTFVATDTVAADGSRAVVQISTNVRNDAATAQTVTLITKVVDATGTVVASNQGSQSVAAGSSYEFKQTAIINNPHLWYPNNCPYGTPYMHKVYHIAKIGDQTVDVCESPLGIRVITWDSDFPYFNGKPMYLWGASARYDYPALGTALPPEVEWRDAKLLADIGGNLWRPGHSSCSPEFVRACDAYGIMLIQPSGEGEGAFNGTAPTDYNGILKTETHRDMIIRDRNHPSILAWEVSNGAISGALASTLKATSVQWDPIHTRAQADRTTTKENGDIHACTLTGCEIGVKNATGMPSWGAEAWGRAAARYDYEHELQFVSEFMQNWKNSKAKKCFGLAAWYLAETPGESPNPGFVDGTPGNSIRSFGSSMLDCNRIPKLLYHTYDVAWNIKPRIAIAHHWNRSGSVRVNVFANTAKVRLLINADTIGIKTPNGWNTATSTATNASTDLPNQCYFDVTWKSGTLRAEGLDANNQVVCFDEKKTAGPRDHIELSLEPTLTKPDGEVFKVKCNGTDAAIVLMKVVDANGNWCPTDTGLVTWSVTGPASYRGGSDQLVTAGKGHGYHAPGDQELAIEGGMAKVAVRSLFTPGTVTVTATVNGLPKPTKSISYTIANLDGSTPVKYGPSGKAALPALSTTMIIAGKKIRYFVNRKADIAVEIVNAGGRVVSRQTDRQQAEGWHAVSTIKLGGAGIYFVKLSANGVQQCVRKLTVIR